MTAILGINAYHADASACLVVDGRVVAAAEEERFRRVKHWAGFPGEAIAWCLRDAGVRIEDVEHFALNSNGRANLLHKVLYGVTRLPDPAFVLQKLRNRRERTGAPEALQAAFPGQRPHGRWHFVEHHRAHLSSAFHASPFEEAVVLSVDGFGDFASGAWGVGRGTDLRIDAQVRFPHSLGAFYTALTQYLGFGNYGDEYKVMGLAPYGEPKYLGQMRRIVRLRPGGRYELDLRYFMHARRRLAHQWSAGTPEVGQHWSPALVELLGPARGRDEPLTQHHRDIARSIQVAYEEAFFHCLRHLHETYRLPAIALAGGCAANSVANGKITLATPFTEVYVQSAAGDAGGAIGAALTTWHDLGGARAEPLRHAYLGPVYDARDIETVLQGYAARLSEAGCTVTPFTDERALCESTAAAIADGRVVGWFQGRMEWGPRALGNRSILGDPRRADMKDILNLKIKRRESFRPFAPSVLREAVPDWFEIDGDVPFMMQVYPIRIERRAAIPAVTHVDGSGRLQTVDATTNPRYHRLIDAFRTLTGVPMVLNTSFNENEPVVCRPEEAIECFLRTRMDRLVLGDTVVERP